MKRNYIKQFNDFLLESKDVNLNTNVELNTLAQDEGEYLEGLISSGSESEEIESAKSGFDAIVKALAGKPNKIVSLLVHTDDNPVIAGHPDLSDESYNFSRFYSKLPRIGEEIWEDEYWSGSPGSNQINLYELPTIEGGTVKLAVWIGAGWDYPIPYMLESDLKKRLR